jgi:hypothetical protein
MKRRDEQIDVGTVDQPLTKYTRLRNDECAENSVKPTQNASQILRERNVNACKRRSITDLPFIDLRVVDIDRRVNETRLTCTQYDASSSISKSIYLHNFWSQTPLNIGDKVRLFCVNMDAERVDVKDDMVDAFIVSRPDTLVQCTAVAGGVYCRRKVVLGLYGGVQTGM